MTYSKDDVSLVDGSLYGEAVIYARCQWFFTEYMVPLLGKRLHDCSMHMIVDSNDDSVRKACPYRLDGLSGSSMQFLPCFEHEGLVHAVNSGEIPPCVRTWLCDGHHLALLGGGERVLGI